MIRHSMALCVRGSRYFLEYIYPKALTWHIPLSNFNLGNRAAKKDTKVTSLNVY